MAKANVKAGASHLPLLLALNEVESDTFKSIVADMKDAMAPVEADLKKAGDNAGKIDALKEANDALKSGALDKSITATLHAAATIRSTTKGRGLKPDAIAAAVDMLYPLPGSKPPEGDTKGRRAYMRVAKLRSLAKLGFDAAPYADVAIEIARGYAAAHPDDVEGEHIYTTFTKVMRDMRDHVKGSKKRNIVARDMALYKLDTYAATRAAAKAKAEAEAKAKAEAAAEAEARAGKTATGDDLDTGNIFAVLRHARWLLGDRLGAAAEPGKLDEAYQDMVRQFEAAGVNPDAAKAEAETKAAPAAPAPEPQPDNMGGMLDELVSDE